MQDTEENEGITLSKLLQTAWASQRDQENILYAGKQQSDSLIRGLQYQSRAHKLQLLFDNLRSDMSSGSACRWTISAADFHLYPY